MIRVGFGIGIYYFVLDRAIPCSSEDELRIYNQKQLIGSVSKELTGSARYAAINNVQTAEECMSKCLADDRCVAFTHFAYAKLCALQDKITAFRPFTFIIGDFTSGVRCNTPSLMVSPTDAHDATWQMSVSEGNYKLYPAGSETIFILHCSK